MRALAILLVIASVSACRRNDSAAAKKDPDEKKGPSPAALVIRKKPPVVGMRVRETNETAFNVDFAVSGGATTKLASSWSQVRVEEVLEVEGMQITKVRVTYEARTETSSTLAAPVTRTSAVVGHTYVIARGDAGPSVTEVTGKPLSSEELVVIEADYRTIVDGDPLADGLPDTPLRPSESVPKLAKALERRMMPKGAAGTLDSEVEVKVEGPTPRGDEIVFNVAAAYQMGGSSAKVTIPLKGTLTVRLADGWVSAFAMSGPMTMSAAGPASISDGKMSVSGKRTYL